MDSSYARGSPGQKEKVSGACQKEKNAKVYEKVDDELKGGSSDFAVAAVVTTKKTPAIEKATAKKSAPGEKASKKLTAYMTLSSKPDPAIPMGEAPLPEKVPRSFGDRPA